MTMPAPPTPTPSHLVGVDTLRGIAIILVFLHHFWLAATKAGVTESLLPGIPFLDALAFLPHRYGFLGVQLFFVISGFCIHRSFVRQRTRHPQMPLAPYLRHFAWRRIWRIYPPYLGVLLVVFCFSYWPFTNPSSAAHLALHLSLSNTLFPGFFYNLNPSFWSIAVEWQLYAIYPVLLLVSMRCGATRAVVLAILTAMIWRFALPRFSDNWFLLHLPMNWWFEWTLGFWLAERHQSGRPVFQHHRPLLAIALPLLGFLLWYGSGPFLLWLAPPLVFTLMLDAASVPGATPSWIERRLAVVGLSSFSLYLIHQPLLTLAARLWGRYLTALPPWLVWSLLCLGSLALLQSLAWLYYRLVELRSIAAGERFVWLLAPQPRS